MNTVLYRGSELVVIRGAGDIATGVALRLARCGYRIVMLEIEQPTAIRRSVAFAQAVYDGSTTVEHLTARRVATAQEALAVTGLREVGVLVDSPMNQVFAYLDDPANADVFVEAVRYRRADK